MRSEFGHPGLRERIVHDAGPFAHEIPQHRLLGSRQRGRLHTFGLNRSSVLPGPQHQVGDTVAENRLTPLFSFQRVDQTERLVVLAAQGPNRPPLERVGCRLRRRKARRDRRLAAHEREIDREMMAAELQHPGRRC